MNHEMKKALLILTALAAITGCGTKSSGITLLVGTYTDTGSAGIYSFTLDPATGESIPMSVTEVSDPSFLCYAPEYGTVYAVTEQSGDGAAVSSFSFDPSDGSLTLKNRRPARGADPCHVTCIGKDVAVANYSSGALSVFPVREDGTMGEATLLEFFESGPDSLRQNSSHIHFSGISPDGDFLFVTDLGGDFLYRFPVCDGRITDYEPARIKMASGSGPRHFTFSGDGRFLYVLGEIGGDVSVFSYNDGDLIPVQEIEADSLHAEGSADIHISPDERFLYTSHRLKGDGIAIFSRNPETGILTRAGYQPTASHPRNFSITSDGHLLLAACRDGDVIQVFVRDSDTGLLKDTHHDIRIPHPVCIVPVQ